MIFSVLKTLFLFFVGAFIFVAFFYWAFLTFGGNMLNDLVTLSLFFAVTVILIIAIWGVLEHDVLRF